jgi:hypothetical protein
LKRAPEKKLYHRLQELSVAESVIEFRGGDRTRSRIDYTAFPVAVQVTWPSGKPCLAVNMYLLEKCYSSTGDTVVATAAKLTELIRYCAGGRVDGRPCGFHELNDSDIAQMVRRLCSDTYIDQPSQRLRNNNTVRTIMRSVFDFLDWYQKTLLLNGRKLIGARSEGAAITVKIQQNSHTRHNYLNHRYLPPAVSTDPKLPIDPSMLEAIDAMIDSLEFRANHPEPALRRFSGDEEYINNCLSYHAARRNFMIFMMRTTGLRPEEMARMSVTANDKSVRAPQPFLILPTMKRRSLNPPLRNFPISPDQSMRVIIYLRARNRWLSYCASRNSTASQTDKIFLSVGSASPGKPVSKSALQKDFEVLCNRAGFSNQQVCFSMFRHRFITDLVHLHLLAFDGQKTVMNKQDYRTLLEKVREKTGHKSIDSLWHYIDLVRGMEGVWDPVNELIRLTQDAEQLRYNLREVHKVGRNGTFENMSLSEILDYIDEPINKFLKASKHVGVAALKEKNRSRH